MSHPSRVRIIGPLVPYAAGFRAELESQGYRPHAVGCQLYVMAHLSRWLAHHSVEVGGLTPERVEEFLVARRAEGYTLWLSEKGVAPLVGYLRRLGVIPVPRGPVAVTAAEICLESFRTYLVEQRGLSAGTVAVDLRIARLFLATRPADDLGLERVVPAEVVVFVRDQCEQRGAAYVTAGLRAFLRFCHLSGRAPRSLVGAVPKVASWRLATSQSARRGARSPSMLKTDSVATR